MEPNPNSEGLTLNTIPSAQSIPDTEPKPTTDIENINYLATQIGKQADELRSIFAEADKITDVTAPAVEKAKALHETITGEIEELEEKKIQIEQNISKDVSIWEGVQREIKNEINDITEKLSDPKKAKKTLEITRRALEERLEHLIHSNEELTKILQDGQISPAEIISLQLGGLDIPQGASESVVHASELYEITNQISARKTVLSRLSSLLEEVWKSDRTTAETEVGQVDEQKKEQEETETDLHKLKKIMRVFARESISSENSGWDPESLCKEIHEVGELIKTYDKFGDNSQGESFRVRLQIRLNSAVNAFTSYFEEAEASSGEAVHHFVSAIDLHKKGYLNEVDFSRILSRAIENYIYSRGGEGIEGIALLLTKNDISNILLTDSDSERIRIALDYAGDLHSGVWRTTVGLPIKLTGKKINPAFERISCALGPKNKERNIKLSNSEQIALASYYANMGDARYLKGLSDEDARQVAFLSFRTFVESNINNGGDHADYIFLVATLCRNEGGGIMTSIKRGLGVGKAPKVSLKDYCEEILLRYFVAPLSKKKTIKINSEIASVFETFGLQDRLPEDSELGKELKRAKIISTKKDKIFEISMAFHSAIGREHNRIYVDPLIKEEDVVTVEEAMVDVLSSLVENEDMHRVNLFINQYNVRREVVERASKKSLVSILSLGYIAPALRVTDKMKLSENILQDEEIREVIKKLVLGSFLINRPGEIGNTVRLVERANFPDDFFTDPKLQENVKNLIIESLLHNKSDLARDLIRVFRVPEATLQSPEIQKIVKDKSLDIK